MKPRCRLRNRSWCSSHSLHIRAIVVGESPAASSPSSCPSAGLKSPVDSPRRYRIGITSPTFGDRRAYAGRIRELNRCRSPVSSSTRLSFTRGARIGIVPDPTVTLRSRARPLRTTSRCPSSSTSSLKRSTYASASTRSAAAIIRRAPSRASSSSAIVISSLPSPTGSLRTSCMACLPAGHRRLRSFVNREGTPPSSSSPSTTFGYNPRSAVWLRCESWPGTSFGRYRASRPMAPTLSVNRWRTRLRKRQARTRRCR